MKNIISYAEENLRPFSSRPLCQVDSLILSWLAYYHFPLETRYWNGAPLRDLYRAEDFPKLLHNVWDRESSKKLLAALAASPRFRNLRVVGATEQRDTGRQKQFAAVTFRLAEDLSYVAFRGTDSTLLGWKENFNMAFQSPVPSQLEAARYLGKAAENCSGTLIVGGHSKGGNLAVYAAASVGADIQGRIRAVYSHDGPGFQKDFFDTPGFQAVEGKIEKTLPQSSIVGLLLDQRGDFTVVQSSHRLSLLQHEPFSWVVQEDRFVVDELAANARYWDQNLDQWLLALSPAERERFVEALFQILSDPNLIDLRELRTDWQKMLPALAQSARNVDPATRLFLLRVVKELVSISLKNYGEFYGRSTPPGL